MKLILLLVVGFLVSSDSHASNYSPHWTTKWRVEQEIESLSFSRFFQSAFNENNSYGIFITYDCIADKLTADFKPNLDIYQIFYPHNDHTLAYDFDKVNIVISFPENSDAKLNSTNLSKKVFSKILNSDFVNLFPRHSKAINTHINSPKYAKNHLYHHKKSSVDRFNFYEFNKVVNAYRHEIFRCKRSHQKSNEVHKSKDNTNIFIMLSSLFLIFISLILILQSVNDRKNIPPKNTSP